MAIALAFPILQLQAQPVVHTQREWREDLSYLVSAMKAVHPAPFHAVSEVTMDHAAAALTRDIPRLTDQQITLRMAAIVALLNDGHCHLSLAPPLFKRERSYPVRLQRFTDGIFVVSARPEAQRIVGARVTSVGGRPAAAAWDSLMVLAAGDNVFSRMSNVPLMLTMPEVMAGLGLANADSLVLGVVRVDGTTERAVVPARTAQFDLSWLSTGWDGPAGANASALPVGVVSLAELHRAAPYWFIQEGRMLYAQVNQVQNSRDTVPLGAERGVVTMDEFARRIIERAEASGVDRLVLDLRFNGGGNNGLSRAFVERIAASAAINRRGHLFVITGRETYSAAMNFTSLLEERTAALFVGEPPGGSPSHYGDNTGFTLPHSKVEFRISTLHWDLGVLPTDVREVMEPDLPAPPRFADHRAGVDAPLAVVAQYHDGNRLSDRLLARYMATGLDSAMALYDAGRSTSKADDPWHSDVQQLIAFAYAVVGPAKQRADIFRAFAMVTERYPASVDAWAASARVNTFVSDWPAVLNAYARAKALRPQNDFIRREYEAATRK